MARLTAVLLAIAPACIGLAWLFAALVVAVRQRGPDMPFDDPQRIGPLLPHLNATLPRAVRFRRSALFTLAALPVSFAGVAVTCVAGSHLRTPVDDLARDGETTTGLVVATRRDERYRRTGYFVAYRYAVGAAGYEARAYVPSLDGLSAGSRAPITYLPGSPSVSRPGTRETLAGERRQERRNGWGFGLLLLTASAFLGVAIWRGTQRAHRLARWGEFRLGTVAEFTPLRYCRRVRIVVDDALGTRVHTWYAPAFGARGRLVRDQRMLLLADAVDPGLINVYDSVHRRLLIDTAAIPASSQ